MNRPISTRAHAMFDYVWAGHLAVDAVMCAALMLSPLFLPRSERRFAAVLVVLGAAGLLTSAFTETKSAGERGTAFTPSRELSEAVADPEVGRTPPLRGYVE